MDFLNLNQFGPATVFDIVIVAYVFYRLLLLIRGTRAVRMAVGLIVLFFFNIGARQLGLRTVDFLLSNVFTYIVFAIIVLFQSEIRRALSNLGRTPFFRALQRRAAEEPFEDVVTAATAMASDRRGAIVVIERQVGLRNYIEGGIELDAAVSYDLLVSIFHPDSPLHDGAVIIQDGRLAAAACFLPLTLNPRLSRDLGSRHRAAIGITEETDAVAVVVSEETGTISLVVDGRITRRVDAAALRRKLRELCGPFLDMTSPEATDSAGTVSGDKATEGASSQ